ncbi:methyltransferase domain-containing protein [Brackiella oedipodis]|uniref:methyltransferase domain-containing protein n=1 Tax=Brackiella oedipodis TaxID=124225 RepID=UPI0005715CBE|nr:methyltransferase domain-containing protein [Brackiella oedipodis]
MPTDVPQNQLPINSQHVIAQFARRPHLAQQAGFLLDEIAERMLARLRYIKLQPKTILDVGCGAAVRTKTLQDYYSQAQLLGIDSNPHYIAQAQQQFKDKVWQKLWPKWQAQQKPRFTCVDMASTGLAPQSVELIWSNLALHWHPRPHAVIAEWQRLLNSQGLAMFSYFGPFTLIELRQALQHVSWRTQTMQFVDMHDFGDLLLENGFMDPVMDQEHITLTYKDPHKLLADVRALGGNPCQERHAGLLSRHQYEELCHALETQKDQNGVIKLTFEVVYGHAWRSAVRQKGQETFISVDAIGRRPAAH